MVRLGRAAGRPATGGWRGVRGPAARAREVCEAGRGAAAGKGILPRMNADKNFAEAGWPDGAVGPAGIGVHLRSSAAKNCFPVGLPGRAWRMVRWRRLGWRRQGQR